MLSRRQVYATAVAHERAVNGGRPAFLNRTASADAKAAAAVAECGDYHTGIAHVLRDRPTQARSARARVVCVGNAGKDRCPCIDLNL
jgi:hypothetical protein